VQEGSIFINLQDTAVYRIENRQQYNKDYVAMAYSTGNSDWTFRKGGVTLEYKKQPDSRYYAKHLSKWYSHTVSDHPYPGDWELDEYFDLWADTVLPVSDHSASEFKAFSNLYSRRYSYNEAWWKSLRILNAHAPDPAILHDLDAYEPLEEQFMKEGREW
jgi:hypothetical protein